MQKSPPPFIWAVPEEKNILDCECRVRSAPRLWWCEANNSCRAFHHCELATHCYRLTLQRGPPDTPYAGGEYHGLIWFPSDYRTSPCADQPAVAHRTAFKPPDVKMFTPSGRFEPGVKICMSMTS